MTKEEKIYKNKYWSIGKQMKSIKINVSTEFVVDFFFFQLMIDWYEGKYIKENIKIFKERGLHEWVMFRTILKPFTSGLSTAKSN